MTKTYKDFDGFCAKCQRCFLKVNSPLCQLVWDIQQIEIDKLRENIRIANNEAQTKICEIYNLETFIKKNHPCIDRDKLKSGEK